jgi:hypothetical protein
MLGFGLRLDTPWQAPAWVLLAVGAALAVRGLTRARRGESASASVPPRDGE